MADFVFKEKDVFKTSRRHSGECYNTVVIGSCEPIGIAYLEVDRKRESLVFQDKRTKTKTVLSSDTYILNPKYVAGCLFWCEPIKGNWQIRAVKFEAGEPGDVFTAFDNQGKPALLSGFSSSDNSGVLVWQQRNGKRTKVMAAKVAGAKTHPAVEIEGVGQNCYDPVCCVSGEDVYLAYGTFCEGLYRIGLTVLDKDLSAKQSPEIISCQNTPSMYPSVYPRREGGVWFSYSNVCVPRWVWEWYFLEHSRFRQMVEFFNFRTVACAAYYDNGKVYAPLASERPAQDQGFLTAGIVYGSTGSGHTQIFEYGGKVSLLMRQHNLALPETFEADSDRQKVSPADKDSKDQGDDPLWSNAGADPVRNHPAITITTLEDDYWTQPRSLIRNGHLELALSTAIDGRELSIAFTEDTRDTGWSDDGEWFSYDGTLKNGIAKIELPEAKAVNYEFRPVCFTPRLVANLANPRLENKKAEGFSVLLGQTHTHSSLSVCIRECDREPHWNYRFGQDFQDLDFTAVTDHAYNMWHTEMLVVRKLADYYNFPGEFTAIAGYEWTGSEAVCARDGGPWGHVNVLNFDDTHELEFYTPCDAECPGGTIEKLWSSCRGRKIITIPHHVADNKHPYNWNCWNSEFEPVVEIFQDRRGSGEQPLAPGVTNYLHNPKAVWVLDALKSGKRFGFIAGGDHGGTALAGVLAKENTREEIFNAIKQRRAFAATNSPVNVCFKCNDALMGSETSCKYAEFSASAQSAEPLAKLQVLREGEIFEEFSLSGTNFTRKWQSEKKRSGEFWYCRIIMENGEMVWTSPIWLL